MDRSDRIAWRAPPVGTGKGRTAVGRGTALAHGASAALALMVLGVTVALLVVATPARNGWPERRVPADPASPPGSPRAATMLGRGDTIDGHPVLDPRFVERMAEVAGRIPPAVLAGQDRGQRVRYLAQAFTPGDDPGLTEGWFEDPAAALAFGCALDDDASLACMSAGEELAPASVASALAGTDTPSHDAVPPGDAVPSRDLARGWHCRPLGIAIGSPLFEPDRCEWPG